MYIRTLHRTVHRFLSSGYGLEAFYRAETVLGGLSFT